MKAECLSLCFLRFGGLSCCIILQKIVIMLVTICIVEPRESGGYHGTKTKR